MRSLSLLLALLFVALLSFPVAAEAAVQPISLFLNGKQLVSEVAPRIVKDNTVVPVRIIAEELGAKVQWDNAARKVTIDKDKVNIQLRIDQTDALVNNAQVAMEIPPAIVEGNTMLPLRFVSEQLGVKVIWDDLKRSVLLFKAVEGGSVSVPGNTTGNTNASGNATGNTNANAGNPNGSLELVSNSGLQTIGPGQSAQPADKTPATDPGKNSSVPANSDGKTQTPAGSGKSQTDTAVKTQPDNGKTATDTSGKGIGPQPTAKPDKPPAIVQSISFAGEQLTLKTSGDDPKPNITKLGGPDRIVVDLPNAKLDPALKLNADGQAEIQVNHPSVQKIRYSLFSSDPSIVRIIIDLKKKADLKIVDSKQKNLLTFQLKPPAKNKIVIDAGHGDKDSGAVSVTGKYEKDFNLSMVLKVVALLEKEPDLEVITTRKDDTFLELSERVAIANNADVDLFLSIHGNKFTNATIRGTETYYTRKESLPFANAIHRAVLAANGFVDRNVRVNDLYVTKNTTMPAVLLEVGYLSNKDEEALMYQDAFQDKVAAAIVAAIKETLNNIQK
ncbi:N-acetylmuramoyl-L-alanine amidase family protein [Paenibacillus thalictri]|uniref:AMIN domain-containing protein n=1 Tax=Paenibacillus thalictri TaxID=2527873 RepID=A0A4Q9DWT2_9BACL|nr:N-acetylmuramoyl-L-alanine amidase family protein [Paenibacillus thalictri]TBL79681.1 AMIN domain-containing protein [Paenibacillus thalictri]